jgi:radical SAM-linked protein
MPVDSTTPPLSQAPAQAVERIRLRFRKDGPLRWLSHHDLMRTFERLLRRADIPFRSSQGFHPHPRLIFALSLPLGVIGCEEIAELELNQPLEPQVVLERLQQQAPPGLTFLAASRVERGRHARVVGFRYSLQIPRESLATVRQRLDEALQASEWWVERTKPAFRRLDIRPFVRAAFLDGDWLRLDLTLTDSGTARPEELLRLFGVPHLLEQGAVLERSHLVLHESSTASGSVD